MERCPVCDCEVPEPGWCGDCIDRTLKEQAREDTTRIRPQIFHS